MAEVTTEKKLFAEILAQMKEKLVSSD